MIGQTDRQAVNSAINRIRKYWTDRQYLDLVCGSLDPQYHHDFNEYLFKLYYHRYYYLFKRYLSWHTPGARFLEVGPGWGHVALIAREAGFSVKTVGLDCNPAVLNIFAACGIEYRQVNIEKDKLPFTDDAFEIISFSEVLEHLAENVNGVLAELYRVLKPDRGNLLIMTDNAARLDNLVYLILGRNIYPPVEAVLNRRSPENHVREYLLPEIITALQAQGFMVNEQRYLPWPVWGPGNLRYTYQANLITWISRIIYFSVVQCLVTRRNYLLVTAKK